MTTASNDGVAASTSPATASGTRMKPPCAIDEYASMRTMFVWRSAARLPSVIDAAASTHRTGCHESCDGKKPKRDDGEQRDEAAGLRRHRQERGDRRRRALVGVGRPEVERHRAHLEREADEREEDRDGEAAARRRRRRRTRDDLGSSVEPVMPKMSDMP